MGHPYESATQHVAGAIRINAQRGHHYAQITGGKSRSLTRRLIALERVSLLPLALFDWWGRKYNKQGIHIIEADFVSMSGINDIKKPLRYCGQANDGLLKTLRLSLKAFAKAAGRSTWCGDFHKTAALTFEMLQHVRSLEDESQSLFSMTRHLLESVGIAALNATNYAAQSGGRTRSLSKTFLNFQLLGVRFAIDIDEKAQSCHALGAGIIENDVPPIPFERKWRARLESRGPPRST